MKVLINLVFIYLYLICEVFSSYAPECSSCFSEGQRCMVLDTNSGSYKNGGECYNGLVCTAKNKGDDEKNWQCMKPIELNGNCSGENSCDIGLTCDPVEYKCLNSRFAQIGEKCSSVLDCSGTLSSCKNGICTVEPSGKCDDASDCEYGSTCSNNLCKPLGKQGEPCDNYKGTHCIYGLTCVTNSSTSGTCGALYSKPLGGTCSSDNDCNQSQNLYCSIKTNICEEYIEPQQPKTNCSLTQDSCDQFHECSCDGKCYQSSAFPTQVSQGIEPLVNCILKNKCTWVTNFFSSDSCMTKNCGSELCKYSGATIFDNALSCGNTHQSEKYCDSNSVSRVSSSIILLISSLIILIFYF
ncbi:hypothetical protein RB653_005054 [Dictyostelium firmibasis]|uniref:Dickkopf N-terminal cysteine-rich domain-containing protein n=1 Tax=Dictyostelium firmibasis TaxID=79012 RepID=A0AAN7YSQ2_9MYCE